MGGDRCCVGVSCLGEVGSGRWGAIGVLCVIALLWAFTCYFHCALNYLVRVCSVYNIPSVCICIEVYGTSDIGSTGEAQW